MSTRIRGQECTLQFVVDGALQSGSFAKVTDFELTTRTDLQETDFIGEVETDLDIQHHGYDFSFTIETADGHAVDLLNTIVEREKDRLPHPDVNVVVALKFREVSEPSKVFVLEKCYLKMDNLSIGGRKEFVKTKWSGKCKTQSGLGVG